MQLSELLAYYYLCPVPQRPPACKEPTLNVPATSSNECNFTTTCEHKSLRHCLHGLPADGRPRVRQAGVLLVDKPPAMVLARERKLLDKRSTGTVPNDLVLVMRLPVIISPTCCQLNGSPQKSGRATKDILPLKAFAGPAAAACLSSFRITV